MLDSKTVESFTELATPFYFYDMALLARTIDAMKRASDKHGYKVHYALKANSNERVLRLMRESGLGADCVSGNEVQRALDMGFSADEIVFAGVGKTDREIRNALRNDIFCFNCESLREIEVIEELATGEGLTARIALRINPNVDAKTHRYITTGLEENKFGIDARQLEEALQLLSKLRHVKIIGLHFHVGSQVTRLGVFKELCLRVNEILHWMQERKVLLPHLNLGGGLGVDYLAPDDHEIPDFESFFDIFARFLRPQPHQQIHFELGRALVAQCGSLISRVIYVKRGMKTNFVILDAGMTELIRPALYQAVHTIQNLTSDDEPQLYDVVGPVCESSDRFGKALMLPKSRRGDLFAIRTAGAYGEVMASRYNLRDLPRAVYSDELSS